MKTVALLLGIILIGCSNPSTPSNSTSPNGNLWYAANEKYPDSLRIYSDHASMYSNNGWESSSSFTATDSSYSFRIDNGEAFEDLDLTIYPDSLAGMDYESVHTGGFSEFAVTFLHAK